MMLVCCHLLGTGRCRTGRSVHKVAIPRTGVSWSVCAVEDCHGVRTYWFLRCRLLYYLMSHVGVTITLCFGGSTFALRLLDSS